MYSITKQLSSPISSLSRAILYFKDKISENRIYRPQQTTKFVFLCGGNQESGELSARRAEVIKFIDKNLPQVKIFNAESVFEILRQEGHKGNYLDIESAISKFADEVIIILESHGAFCELGVFSAKSLREKLIIINDEKYKAAQSFINLGPLEAIKETGRHKKIIHYKMTESTLSKADAIGDTFFQLQEILASIPHEEAGFVKRKNCNPRLSFEKDTIRFIHDLIFFSEPITYKELVEIIKKLFGDEDYSRLRQHIGLLKATNLIDVKKIDGRDYYVSKMSVTLLHHLFNSNLIISSFRTIYQKYDFIRLSNVKR